MTRLAAEGQHVRALTSDPGATRTKWPEGVTAVQADFSVPATTAEWEELWRGRHLAVPAHRRHGRERRGLRRGGRTGGVRRIVVLSSGAVTEDDAR